MLDLRYFIAFEETPEAQRDAYVAKELRRIVAEGQPLLTSILRTPDDEAKTRALELLRDNATDLGDRVFESAPSSFRLRLAEDATPPDRDAQARKLPENKRGNTLVVKLGNKGGRLTSEKADPKLVSRFSGKQRQILATGMADLYEQAEITRTARSFAQREATLILRTWGVGVQAQRCLTHYDREKGELVEGQSFYLVEEEPQPRELAGPTDDEKTEKAAKPPKARG